MRQAKHGDTATEVTESEVTLDANHPLAGEHSTFDIELIEGHTV
jgi:FKBP-type peptidyl-prolyl cis-trans isomerase 2